MKKYFENSIKSLLHFRIGIFIGGNILAFTTYIYESVKNNKIPVTGTLNISLIMCVILLLAMILLLFMMDEGSGMVDDIRNMIEHMEDEKVNIIEYAKFYRKRCCVKKNISIVIAAVSLVDMVILMILQTISQENSYAWTLVAATCFLTEFAGVMENICKMNVVSKEYILSLEGKK